MVIYKITNKINNKCYIGQTVQTNPWRRIRGHFNPKEYRGVCLIKRAIKKYGKDNFVVEIIYTATDLEDLNDKEQYYIKSFNSLNPSGYNIRSGGNNGGALPDYIIEKIRQKQIGKPGVFKGKKFTKEHREALSRARKGVPKTEKQLIAIRKIHETFKKKIKATNLITQEVIIFDSIIEAAKRLNCQSGNISRVCNNKQNRTQHKGWKFTYI